MQLAIFDYALKQGLTVDVLVDTKRSAQPAVQRRGRNAASNGVPGDREPRKTTDLLLAIETRDTRRRFGPSELPGYAVPIGYPSTRVPV